MIATPGAPGAPAARLRASRRRSTLAAGAAAVVVGAAGLIWVATKAVPSAGVAPPVAPWAQVQELGFRVDLPTRPTTVVPPILPGTAAAGPPPAREPSPAPALAQPPAPVAPPPSTARSSVFPPAATPPPLTGSPAAQLAPPAQPAPVAPTATVTTPAPPALGVTVTTAVDGDEAFTVVRLGALDGAQPEAVLGAALRALSSVPATVLSVRPGRTGPFASADLTARLPSAFLHGRLMVVGHHAYLVAELGRTEVTPPDLERFLRSFDPDPAVP